MNTQTHILLACSALIPSLDKQPRFTRIGVVVAVIAGALLPDASIFLMWGVAKFQGVPESVIWQEWYYSEFWQQIGAVSNSIPLFLLLAIGAWMAGARPPWVVGHFSSNAMLRQSENQQSFFLSPAFLILLFAFAALLHTLTDFPLHHDDGHPHFWPLTSWIYESPVSYWDPRHYGRQWLLIESILAMTLIVLLWRRFRRSVIRFVLVLVAISYPVAIAYWVLSL